MTLTDIENLGNTATLGGPLNARFARELTRVVEDYKNNYCDFNRKNEIATEYFGHYKGTELEHDAWALQALDVVKQFTK